MKILTKKRIFYVLKIILTITILFFIFQKIPLKETFTNFLKIKIPVFLILLVSATIKLFIQYNNWRRYLMTNPAYVPIKNEVIKSFFIGEALRFLLPGGHAVFGKIFFVNQKKKSTMTSVVLERLFKTWTILLFASFSSLFFFDQYLLVWRLTIFLFFVISPLLFYFLIRFIHIDFFQNLSKEYLKIIPFISLNQIIYVCLTMIQYFFIINSFFQISFFSIIIAVPLILFANIIPITYAGLGLREFFAINILSHFSISSDIAVATSLLIFIFNSIIPAFIGLYFFTQFKKNRKLVE